MGKYLQILINDEPVDLSSVEDIPLTINYRLEDDKDFTTKKGSEALSITVPATPKNDRIANTYHNPGIEDLTTGQIHKSLKKSKIISNGNELLIGKAFLKEATHTDKPLSYEYDFYGNNSDWVIDLKETKLYDLLKHISFIFTKQHIIDSWSYNGTNESIPYVFAPVRYGNPMESFISLVDGNTIEDYNMIPEYMKPALSKYWIIYWAFKSLGYKIKSDFFDTSYFRRQVMPWTWGSFLDSDGTKLEVLKFLAKSTETIVKNNVSFTGFLDVKATNDYQNGAYDNSGVYDYANPLMRWTYLTAPQYNFGLLQAMFHISVYVNAKVSGNSDVELRVQWFKNGTRIQNGNDNGNGTELVNLNAPTIGQRTFVGLVEDWFPIVVNQGDIITAKLYLHTFKSGLGQVKFSCSVDSIEIDYFKTPIGGTVNFDNLLSLKNYKFLDLFRGVVDEFDLTLQTDNSTKTIYIEPSHPYSLTNDLSNVLGGYFNGKYLDWSYKQDLSKKSVLYPFTDSERELLFGYKDDSNDGTLKKTQDRNNIKIGQAKYVLPDRFLVGQKPIENRFFAPTMHYEVHQWALDLLEPPQMIIMAPENISNLSNNEAQNTFLPKSVYYKGTTTNYKWIFDGEDFHPYPFMFAVNYKSGGENDPVLSYCDEVIGNTKGKGLLRRFFLQRLNIMAYGQYYSTWFKLNYNDITNILHREFIICRGQKWEIVQIDYEPLKNESSKVLLKKWTPVLNG